MRAIPFARLTKLADAAILTTASLGLCLRAHGRTQMSRFALLVSLKAKVGKEKEVAAFLASAEPLVDAEPATMTWHAGQLDAQTFMIFDAFDDEAGRDAHLNGAVAQALMANAAALLAEPPSIRKIDILADMVR
jgi:quinol monooxygenase YgiN